MTSLSRLLLVAAGFLAAVLPFASHAQSPVQKTAQEKRIALVVGNAAYPDHALATTANDGGLIAQTLQAAGFDVVGARDLDAESLRRALRDFVQKAQASGPDTVAFVYLAGYGMQLAGENYFVPIDASPARDIDVPVETLRVNDYLRQLQALPLKAGIVVLDAARETPFAKGGQPLAGGLALVEPDGRIFTAFNAAPGTVAPETAGPYGPYAQSLAEMIRTGGLTLPEVFDRVRLRVNELTKGAQIPWDTRKIDANVMFFDRAPDAPQTTAAVPDRSKPIASYDAPAAYAAALERDTLPDYDAFVAAYPDDPLARRVRVIIAARREAITWRRSYLVNTPESYWSYLRRYPRGPHAYDARRRLAILTAPVEPPPSFAMIAYDVPPPPPEEIVYVDRPVLAFNDPYFGFAPPPPPPVYFLPPPPPDFIVLEPPPPPIGLFLLPRPLFVPFPLYVVAPAYVSPPRNNVIFANIHNTTVINNLFNNPAPVANAGPGRPAGARAGVAPLAAAAPVGTPALPPSVAQRAALIQQGRLAAPRGVINRAAVTPGATPAATPAAPAAAARIGAPLPGATPGSPLPRTGPAAGRAALTPSGALVPPPGPTTPRAAPSVRTAIPQAGAPQRPFAAPVRPNPPRPAIAARTPPAAPVVQQPRRFAPPPVARVAAPRPPSPPPAFRPPPPQIQRPPPVQAIARPAPPPRMAAPPPRAAPARPGPPPKCPPNVRCR